MYKRIALFAVIICFIIVTAAPFAAAASYSSANYHYSLDIPEGWTQIPDECMSEMRKQVNESLRSRGKSVIVDTGFMSDTLDQFGFPYVVITQFEEGSSSFEAISRVFSSSNMNEALGQARRVLANNMSVIETRFDQRRNMIIVTGEMNHAEAGKVVAYMAICPGSNSIAQINCYSVQADFPNSLAAFDSVLDSFRYESGYEYVHRPPVVGGVAGLMQDIKTLATIALIVAIWLYRNQKRRNEAREREKAAA